MTLGAHPAEIFAEGYSAVRLFLERHPDFEPEGLTPDWGALQFEPARSVRLEDVQSYIVGGETVEAAIVVILNVTRELPDGLLRVKVPARGGPDAFGCVDAVAEVALQATIPATYKEKIEAPSGDGFCCHLGPRSPWSNDCDGYYAGGWVPSRSSGCPLFNDGKSPRLYGLLNGCPRMSLPINCLQ